jgi:hypothetical protein
MQPTEKSDDVMKLFAARALQASRSLRRSGLVNASGGLIRFAALFQLFHYIHRFWGK